MKDNMINSFIEKVKLESTYHKFLERDLIYKLIDFFDGDYKKIEYSKKIEDPLDMAQKFYKDYNKKYYNMVLEGIKNKRIIIENSEKKSYVDTESNAAFIKPFGNDVDLIMFVHEFAHFIDRNSDPLITPHKYDFLSEVFSMYMEKQLELWLTDEKYEELISARRSNRMYFESKMMKAIKYELYYENLYREKGNINEEDLDVSEIKYIMRYDCDLDIGTINYLLRYPLANILSDYLIKNNLVKDDYDICKICLNTNLYDVLENSLRNL